MKLTVFGSGYVGLVTATCFAEMGHTVIVIDTDQKKIENLNHGISPIYEPGLDEMIASNMHAGRLLFSQDAQLGVTASDILFIAVGTPPGEDGSADMRFVIQVAETIGKHMNGYKMIVNKSTVPVGSVDRVASCIQSAHPFDVVSNPEFLKEGSAIEDCMKPARIVIGAETERAKKIMQDLYMPFVRNGHPVLFMDTRSAELTKYAANAMLAVRISFMNELSRLCEKVGADIEQIRYGLGSDPRIGREFLYAGIGYGGSCFPKDVQALIQIFASNDDQAYLLEATEKINTLQQQRFAEKIIASQGTVFAVWGIAFKPGTDDIREAPSLIIVRQLLQAGLKVQLFDPIVKCVEGMNSIDDQYEVLNDVDALIIATEWKPFREPDFAKMRSKMHRPVIFDGRNMYDPSKMKELGFSYHSVGRI